MTYKSLAQTRRHRLEHGLSDLENKAVRNAHFNWFFGCATDAKSLAHHWRKILCATTACAVSKKAGAFGCASAFYLLAHGCAAVEHWSSGAQHCTATRSQTER
jgi:hypothetical protein